MRVLVEIFVILQLITRISCRTQCYFQVGTARNDPETLGPGTNSLSAPTLVMYLDIDENTVSEFTFDRANPFLKPRWDPSSKTYLPALTQYQLFARHVFAHFRFKLIAHDLLFGFPFDPNRPDCSETCVRWYPNTRELRITSEILNVYSPMYIEYVPPPLSHPTHIILQAGLHAGILGHGEHPWNCTAPAISNSFPYIVSAMMLYSKYLEAPPIRTLISFSHQVVVCPGEVAVAYPMLSMVKNDPSKYNSKPYACPLYISVHGPASPMHFANGNRLPAGEVWMGNCPTVTGFDPYYMYGVEVSGLCVAIWEEIKGFGVGYVAKRIPTVRFEYPLWRTRGWFIGPNIYTGLMPLSSDVLLCSLDWNLPTRRAYLYDPVTNKPTHMVIKTPYPIDRTSVFADDGYWGNWGLTANTVNYVFVRAGKFSFAGTSFGINQPLVHGTTVYTGFGYWPHTTRYESFVPPSIFVPIDSGSIYGTLAMSFFKWNDANQNPYGIPFVTAYPTFVAITGSAIPSDKMKFTATNQGFARLYPAVRYVGTMKSPIDLPNMQVMDNRGISSEHFYSVQYGVPGLNAPLDFNYPRGDSAGFAYLSSAAETTMPVFGRSVAMPHSHYTPLFALIAQQDKTIRLLFAEGGINPIVFHTDRIFVTCNGETRSVVSITALGSRLDILDPIGCLDDPIILTLENGYVFLRQPGFLPDLYAARTVLTPQLPVWVPVALGNVWIHPISPSSTTGHRYLTVTFNMTIASTVDQAIEVICGTSPATVSKANVTGLSLRMLISGCGFVPGTITISIPRYAILFQSLPTGEAVVLPLSIRSYPVPVIDHIGASMRSPFCSGPVALVPIVPQTNLSLGFAVNYKFVCDGDTLFERNGTFGPYTAAFVPSGTSSCVFTATSLLPSLAYTVPIPLFCGNSTVLVIDSHYEAVEHAVYVRFGSEYTILQDSITRSKFQVTCDRVPAVVQLVSVASPAIVDRTPPVLPGPVLIINVTDCSLDPINGTLNLTIGSRAFSFSSTETVSATVTTGPRFLPTYSSRSCRVLDSDVHMNVLNLTLAPDLLSITHSLDGCVHVFPPAVDGASVVFYVRTQTNRPCNSQLLLRSRFGIQQPIYLSYGHCDDLPYFNLDPVVNYVFTGAVNGRAYNADYGQYGSGGVTWVTDFRSVPNVDAQTGSFFGGLKDSIGVPGLNLTAYCWTDNPLINSVNPLSGFYRKRAYQGNKYWYDNWADWTVVITLDRQLPRSYGTGYNPSRPVGLHSISPYRTVTNTGNHAPSASPTYTTYINTQNAVELLSIGHTINGKFSGIASVVLTSTNGQSSFSVTLKTDRHTTTVGFAHIPGTTSALGHMKIVFQRYCTGADSCHGRVFLLDEAGRITHGKDGYTFSFDFIGALLAGDKAIRIGGNQVISDAFERQTGSERFCSGGTCFYANVATRTGCIDYTDQFILQGVAIYDRNLNEDEIGLVSRRRPPTGGASVESSVLLGQYLPYNVTKEVRVYSYSGEVPWLFNRSNSSYSLILDGRNETTSFAAPGTFGFTLTVDGWQLRHTDTVFGRGLTVQIIPREAAPSFRSLSVALPAFANISLLDNIDIRQIASRRNTIRRIEIGTTPANVSLYLINGTRSLVSQNGTYSVTTGSDLIARWEFTSSLPSRVDLLDVSYVTMGVTDDAVMVANTLAVTEITLLLKTPIVVPTPTPYTCIEDSSVVFDIPPASVYSATGIPERCDSVIFTWLPARGSLRLLSRESNATESPMLDFVAFNCTTRRLLYVPDPDFDQTDFFLIVYNCSIAQSVPQNLTIQVTPVEDGPKTTTALDGSIVVSDPYTYPYVPLDVREVDTLEQFWKIKIQINPYTASFFNKSIATLLHVLPTTSVAFPQGNPLYVNPTIIFYIYGNHTLLSEVMKSVRFVCGTKMKAPLYILIQDKRQEGTGDGLVFTRTIDCQVVTFGSASDPDTPDNFIVQPPGGAEASLVNNITVLAISLVFLPGIGLVIVLCMYGAKNALQKYKKGLDTGLKAADSLSKGDFKGAVSQGIELAKIAKG